MICRKNFTGMDVGDIPKDSEYHNCNFAQYSCIDDDGVKKGIRLFPGDDTPRTFVNCNMTNCEPPPGSICTHCNQALVERAIVVSTDTVEIDGFSIEVKKYVDRIHGKMSSTRYMRLSHPEDIPIEVEVVEGE